MLGQCETLAALGAPNFCGTLRVAVAREFLGFRSGWCVSAHFAGFVVEYGSSQIDLSVKGQLDKITTELEASNVAV